MFFIWTLIATEFSFVFVACMDTGEELPSFVEQPTWPDRNYYDEDGPPILLSCQLNSYKETHIYWYKDGLLTKHQPGMYELSTWNATLTLPDPKERQTGEYMCLAVNSNGSINHTGYLLITGREQAPRPRIVDTFPSTSVVHAGIGASVNISCTFDVGGSEEALVDLILDWRRSEKSVNDTNHTTWGLYMTKTNNQVLLLTIDNLQPGDYGTYECYGENEQGNSSTSLTISPPIEHHKTLPLTVIIGASAGGLCVFVILVAMVIWKVKKRNPYEELDWTDAEDRYDVPDRKIEFDVFISYSSDDLSWVKDMLFYNLESAGYKVCIDFKDFVAGLPVTENIMDSIYKSKKTIVLMSKNFLRSLWGQFELQQAHHRAILQRKDVLILIRHDSSKVPVQLMGKTFLDWNDKNVQPHFWTRLYEAIGTPGDLADPEQDLGVADVEQNTVMEDISNEQNISSDNQLTLNVNNNNNNNTEVVNGFKPIYI